MNERNDFHLLRHTLAPPSAGDVSSACPSDDTLAAFSEGTLETAERGATLLHLTTCIRCRGAVASLSRTFASHDVARELTVLERGNRRINRIAISAAVAAVLLVLLARTPSDDGAERTHRAPTIAASEGPVLVPPLAFDSGMTVLQWHPVLGADRYRVGLFDATGRVLYQRQLTDTFALLPDSIRLRVGGTYLWRVDARTGFDRWAPSEFTRFAVRARP